MSCRKPKHRFRALDWIFQRAQSFARSGNPEEAPSRSEGVKAYSWMRDTVAMIQDISANPENIRRLERRYGSLYEAYLYYTQPSRELLRYSLELTLVSGCDNQEIFNHLMMDDDTIEAYSTVFYNIRPTLPFKLLARAHVLNGINNPSALSNQDIYKLVGYYRGLGAAMYVMDGFAAVDHVTKDNLVSALSDDVVEALKRQALLAALRVNATGHGGTEIIHAFVKNREVETKENLNDQATDHLQEGLDALIASLGKRVTIGGYDPATGQPATRMQRIVANSAVELPQSAIGYRPVMQRLASAAYPNMVSSST